MPGWLSRRRPPHRGVDLRPASAGRHGCGCPAPPEIQQGLPSASRPATGGRRYALGSMTTLIRAGGRGVEGSPPEVHNAQAMRSTDGRAFSSGLEARRCVSRVGSWQQQRGHVRGRGQAGRKSYLITYPVRVTTTLSPARASFPGSMAAPRRFHQHIVSGESGTAPRNIDPGDDDLRSTSLNGSHACARLPNRKAAATACSATSPRW
jgi:hypothetical protein